MRNDQPLAALHRRLGLAPAGARDGEGSDTDTDDEPTPGWVPDGRPAGPRTWLTAVRADPGRSGALALAAVAVLAVLITVFTLMRSSPQPVVSAKLPPVETVSTTTTAAPGPPSGTRVVVSVVGLVQQPGLVTVSPDARVADAVAAAGGPLRGADTLGLNLARHVADGEQIVVGIAAPAGRPATLGSSVNAGPSQPSPAGPRPAGPVNLNTATAEQLDALPGVGPVTAAAIVTWRQSNGRFTSVDQLAEVDGIGTARLERLRPLVAV